MTRWWYGCQHGRVLAEPTCQHRLFSGLIYGWPLQKEVCDGKKKWQRLWRIQRVSWLEWFQHYKASLRVSFLCWSWYGHYHSELLSYQLIFWSFQQCDCKRYIHYGSEVESGTWQDAHALCLSTSIQGNSPFWEVSSRGTWEFSSEPAKFAPIILVKILKTENMQ